MFACLASVRERVVHLWIQLIACRPGFVCRRLVIGDPLPFGRVRQAVGAVPGACVTSLTVRPEEPAALARQAVGRVRARPRFAARRQPAGRAGRVSGAGRDERCKDRRCRHAMCHPWSARRHRPVPYHSRVRRNPASRPPPSLAPRSIPALDRTRRRASDQFRPAQILLPSPSPGIAKFMAPTSSGSAT